MGISLTQDSVRASFASSRRQTVTREGFQLAAVLVPLVFTPTGVELLFTKRTETVETHKGQVSFPGGVVDAGDRDIKATATREAMEEIGIREEDIEVVGFLDDLATPTGFIITPVVAFLRPAVALAPNWEEVAEVFYMPLDFFAAPEHGRHEMRNVMGKEREVWHYDTGTHSIWGATAAIVRSLLIVLRLIDPAGSGR